MARTEDSKKKLLLLRRLLEEETDEQHPVTLRDIIDYYARFGLTAERKSVYSDLHALEEDGMDIIHSNKAPEGYYLASRSFELSELKLLVDAVQSCRFLTDKKSMELIAKLSSLCSRSEAGQLKRQVTVSGRARTMNESILYNVDTLHAAITSNLQIRFRYFDWGVDREKHFRERAYTASPYALCWDDENYYLIAHSDRHGLTHYRVDKMSDISLLELPRVHTKETDTLDMAAYSRRVFGMFRGDETTVRIRFANRLAGVVIDRFGHDSMLVPDGTEHFTLTTSVSLSPNFIAWLVQFGGDAKPVWPESAVEKYRALLSNALKQDAE